MTHIPRQEKSNQFFKVQSKHSPFHVSSSPLPWVEMTSGLCAPAAFPQLRCCLTWAGPGTATQESTSWTQILSQTTSLNIPSSTTSVKLLAITRVRFSTIWDNVIPSHYKTQGQEWRPLWSRRRAVFLCFQIRTWFFSKRFLNNHAIPLFKWNVSTLITYLRTAQRFLQFYLKFVSDMSCQEFMALNPGHRGGERSTQVDVITGAHTGFHSVSHPALLTWRTSTAISPFPKHQMVLGVE